VRPENAALLRDFFASARGCLRSSAGPNINRSGQAQAEGGVVVVLLHVCIIGGVAEDQWEAWGVAELAREAGLRRVAALPWSRRRRHRARRDGGGGAAETGGGAGGGRSGSSETPSPDHIEEDFPGYQPRARDGRSFAPDGGLFHVLRAL
jgi:hypothetical protein